MMQKHVGPRSPVGQGVGGEFQPLLSQEDMRFITLTEEELLISYCLTYSGEPDRIINSSYKEKDLIIWVYTSLRPRKLFIQKLNTSGSS